MKIYKIIQKLSITWMIILSTQAWAAGNTLIAPQPLQRDLGGHASHGRFGGLSSLFWIFSKNNLLEFFKPNPSKLKKLDTQSQTKTTYEEVLASKTSSQVETSALRDMSEAAKIEQEEIKRTKEFLRSNPAILNRLLISLGVKEGSEQNLMLAAQLCIESEFNLENLNLVLHDSRKKSAQETAKTSQTPVTCSGIHQCADDPKRMGGQGKGIEPSSSANFYSTDFDPDAIELESFQTPVTCSGIHQCADDPKRMEGQAKEGKSSSSATSSSKQKKAEEEDEDEDLPTSLPAPAYAPSLKIIGFIHQDVITALTKMQHEGSLPENIVLNPGEHDTSLTGYIYHPVNLETHKEKDPRQQYREKLATSSLLGMLLGDAAGQPHEFLAFNSKEGFVVRDSKSIDMQDGRIKFQLLAGQYTDDASMGLCLQDSLLANKGLNLRDLLVRFNLWWHHGYNNGLLDKHGKLRSSVGLGGNIRVSLNNFLSTGKEHAPKMEMADGNGGLMRLAPIAVLYNHDIEAAMTAAEIQSRATHSGSEAAELARMMAFIIVRAIQLRSENITLSQRDNIVVVSPQFNPRDIIDIVLIEMETIFKNSTVDIVKKLAIGKGNQDWLNWRDPNLGIHIGSFGKDGDYYGAYSAVAMALALHYIYHASSFEEAVTWAVNANGDADTVASITAQMAAPLFGGTAAIPQRWIDQLYATKRPKGFSIDGVLAKSSMLYAMGEPKDKSAEAAEEEEEEEYYDAE